MKSACDLINSIGDQDRARGNLAAFVLSACSVVTPTIVPIIANVSMDEAHFAETVSPLIMKNVVIAQLNGRAADFRAVEFDGGCNVVSLIADQGTVPSLTFPFPAILGLPDRTLRSPGEISQWLFRQAKTFGFGQSASINELLNGLEPFALLARIARYKPFWLKDCDEKAARRILDDPHWDLIRRLLEKHDLMSERLDVPASGRPAPFYHFKNRAGLRDLEKPPEALWPFLNELFSESLIIRANSRATDQL